MALPPKNEALPPGVPVLPTLMLMFLVATRLVSAFMVAVALLLLLPELFAQGGRDLRSPACRNRRPAPGVLLPTVRLMLAPEMVVPTSAVAASEVNAPNSVLVLAVMLSPPAMTPLPANVRVTPFLPLMPVLACRLAVRTASLPMS